VSISMLLELAVSTAGERVGLGSRRGGITCTVVLAAGASAAPAQLREYARTRLRSSRTPDDVLLWTDDLPRNAMGKLLRRTLVDEVTQARSTGVPEAAEPTSKTETGAQ
jgi:acyl-coenzyme A synthetase/AMP-(fatty) acid ligase